MHANLPPRRLPTRLERARAAPGEPAPVGHGEPFALSCCPVWFTSTLKVVFCASNFYFLLHLHLIYWSLPHPLIILRRFPSCSR